MSSPIVIDSDGDSQGKTYFHILLIGVLLSIIAGLIGVIVWLEFFRDNNKDGDDKSGGGAAGGGGGDSGGSGGGSGGSGGTSPPGGGDGDKPPPPNGDNGSNVPDSQLTFIQNLSRETGIAESGLKAVFGLIVVAFFAALSIAGYAFYHRRRSIERFRDAIMTISDSVKRGKKLSEQEFINLVENVEGTPAFKGAKDAIMNFPEQVKGWYGEYQKRKNKNKTNEEEVEGA